MIRDPLARLPVTGRLWTAVLLCVVPLGLSGSTTHVSQSPARVFLLAAAVALVFTATRLRTDLTRRVARLATGSLAFAAVLAASHRATLTLVCVLAALALVVPAVWRRPNRGAERVFGANSPPG